MNKKLRVNPLRESNDALPLITHISVSNNSDAESYAQNEFSIFKKRKEPSPEKLAVPQPSRLLASDIDFFEVQLDRLREECDEIIQKRVKDELEEKYNLK